MVVFSLAKLHRQVIRFTLTTLVQANSQSDPKRTRQQSLSCFMLHWLLCLLNKWGLQSLQSNIHINNRKTRLQQSSLNPASLFSPSYPTLYYYSFGCICRTHSHRSTYVKSQKQRALPTISFGDSVKFLNHKQQEQPKDSVLFKPFFPMEITLTEVDGPFICQSHPGSVRVNSIRDVDYLVCL